MGGRRPCGCQKIFRDGSTVIPSDALTEITEAIIANRGPYAPYLALAIACEQDDQSSIETLARQIGYEVDDINKVHMDALLWAQELSADV